MSSTCSYDESYHLVVGAGILGCLCSAAYKAAGIPVVVFERESDLGGVWNGQLNVGIVNTESRPQVDPASFRPSGDFSEIQSREGAFGGIWQRPEDIVQTLKQHTETAGVSIFYHRIVIGWSRNSSGSIVVEWKNLSTGEIKKEIFAGLHLRTGSQAKPRNISIRGQEKFEGARSFGIRNDVKLEQLKDRSVVILGGGATSTDNAIRAVLAGAKSVTVVARHQRFLFPSFATYLLLGLASDELLQNPSYCVESYVKAGQAMDKAWKESGAEAIVDRSRMIEIHGQRHYKCVNGFDSFRSDPLLVAYYYGLIKFLVDEPTALTASTVELKSGSSLNCDVLLQCYGYDSDDSLLQGHTILGTLFVDSSPNVTQFVGADRVSGTKLFGPLIPDASLLVPNFFAAQPFDEIAIYYQSHPEEFEGFLKSPMFTSVLDPANFDSFEAVRLLPKVLFSGQASAQFVIKSLGQRREMRSKLLPIKQFLEFNRREWLTWSTLMAERTGKPLMKYPFEEEWNAAQ
jgi:thioredoxin reductase